MQTYRHPGSSEDMMAAEAEREYANRSAPAATLSDAHAEWHLVHGRDAVCPLDCGAGEYLNDDYDEPEPEPSIRCGHCSSTHHSVAEVRACANTGCQIVDAAGAAALPCPAEDSGGIRCENKTPHLVDSDQHWVSDHTIAHALAGNAYTCSAIN